MDYEIYQLLGKTLTSVIKNDDNNEIVFTVDDGTQFKMYHQQDCCESVSIDDIEGDLNDLVGSPILVAEENVSSDPTPAQIAEKEERKKKEGDNYYDYDESFTWTFYKLATQKGYVNIRWHGESNGYYSERVDLVKIGEEYY